MYYIQELQKLANEYKLTFAMHSGGIKTTGKAQKEYEEKLIIHIKNQEICSLGTGKNLNEAKEDGAYKLLNVLLTHKISKRIKQSINVILDNGEKKKEKKTEKKERVNSKEKIPDESKSTNWQIKKEICVLGESKSGKRNFAVVTKAGVDDCYCIGDWRMGQLKNGVFFGPTEAESICKLLDDIMPLPLKLKNELYYIQELQKLANEYKLTFAMHSGGIKTTGKAQKEYEEKLIIYIKNQEICSLGTGKNLNEAKEDGAYKLLNVLLTHKISKRIKQSINVILDNGEKKKEKKTETEEKVNSKGKIPDEIKSTNWQIKKKICVLGESKSGKRNFAVVTKAGVDDCYCIGDWRMGQLKNGVFFGPTEAESICKLLDDIMPLPLKLKKETRGKKEISGKKESSSSIINEVASGDTTTLSAQMKPEEQLEIIRSELKGRNKFETYCGHSDKLLPHQKAACRIAEIYDRFAFFYDTGTGKTVLALDIIASKHRKDETRFLIICPKPIIRTGWLEDQMNFYPEMRLAPLSSNIKLEHYVEINRRWNKLIGRNEFDDHFDFGEWQNGSKAQRLKNIKRVIIKKADHYIVNSEAFIRDVDFYKRLNVNGVIIDESSIIKNPGSKITKALLEFTSDCKYVYLLSGKPAPNNTLEYFSQMKIASPDDFHMSYYAFKKRYFKTENGHVVIKSQKDQEKLIQMIAKRSIVVAKEDCLQLPDTVHMIRKINLDDEVMEKYNAMYNDYFIEIERKEKESKINKTFYTAENKLASLMKLREIVSGFILDDNNKPCNIHKNKIEELLHVLDEIGDAQVIIWCQFQYEIEVLESELKKVGKTVLTAYSKRKGGTLDDNIKKFKNGEADILLAHPKTLQYGVTLTNCHYSIYYSLSYSFEQYYQCHDRIYRFGQGKECTYIFLQAEDTIDELIYQCVMNKKKHAVFYEELIKDAKKHHIAYNKAVNR